MSDSQNKKRKKRKARRIATRALTILLIVALTVSGGYVILDKVVTGMYNKTTEVPLDIRTADDIKEDVINILVCGLDWEEERSAMMTDVIMYVTLDAKAKKISVLQIPRDTYIGTDITPTGKINSVYWHGKEKDKVMNTVKLINSKLKMPVDHYVTLDMEAFIAMVDAIDGGLRMYVPCPIIAKDKDTGVQETIIETAGWYNIGGQTAEAIVRNRNYPEGDIQRLEVQGYFYAAIIKYFKDIGISDCLKIMPRFTPYLTTDLHWTQMASLAATALKIDYNDMALIKPTVNGMVSNGQAIVTVQKSEWAELLNQYFRPYQDKLTADDLDIPDPTDITTEYGATETKIQTIGEILANSPE